MELYPPKLLDQSKNVTVRSYHKLAKDQNGPKKWPKSVKKCQKEPKFGFPMCHVAKPDEAGQSVVTCVYYDILFVFFKNNFMFS